MSAFREQDYKGIVIDRTSASDTTEEALTDAILVQIADNLHIEIPEDRIEAQSRLNLREHLYRIQYGNMMNGHLYEAVAEFRQNVDAHLAQFREQAICQLKMDAVVDGIIEAENIQVTQKELEEEGQAIADQENTTLAEVRTFLGEDLALLKRELQEKKVRSLVYAHAVIQ